MTQEIEQEQKLKLSTSNIISLAAVVITLLGGYINLTVDITKLNQRVASNEKSLENQDKYKGQIDFKLDKIIESVNQIKVDNAEKRLFDAQNNK